MSIQPVIFTVPGEVRAWARTGTNRGQHFTKPKDRHRRTHIEDLGAAAMAGRPPFSTSLELRLTIRRAIPASAPKSKRAAMLSGDIRPGKRPDCDNIAKGVGDALNKICWVDDALIDELHVSRIYAEIEGLEVFIRPLGECGL